MEDIDTISVFVCRSCACWGSSECFVTERVITLWEKEQAKKTKKHHMISTSRSEGKCPLGPIKPYTNRNCTSNAALTTAARAHACVCVIIGDLWKWVICCITSNVFVFLQCPCDQTRGKSSWRRSNTCKRWQLWNTAACVPVFCSRSLHYPSKALHSTVCLFLLPSK